MRRIPTGIVGYGLAGRVFHAPFISAVPQLELQSIVQRHGDTAKAAWPGVALLRSFEDLLGSAVELVVIATPNPLHFSMTRDALLAGKHVVCDKPMCLSSGEAEDLEHLAREKGLLLFPFHNRRWDGDFLTLQAVLNAGRVGRAVLLESRFDRYRPSPKPGAWREEEEGGGQLYDIGPHLIDQALTLFGRPDHLYAELRRDRNTGKVPDGFDLTLRYTSDSRRLLTVRLGVTVLATIPAPRFRLLGTGGAYIKQGLDPQEAAVAGGALPPSLDSGEAWLAEPESQSGTLTTCPDMDRPNELAQETVRTAPGDYRGFYRNVAESILGMAAPAVTARCAVRVARLFELALESQRTGATVRVDHTGW